MTNLIEKFYEAFARRDAETMISCYHKEITFEDAAFGRLHGDDARDMWKMLCRASKDLKVSYSGIECDQQKGLASWQADYTFTQTGRKVHNQVLAKFRFKDGKIIEHTDLFNLHTWASQALGWKGRILGGTEFFKKSLQKQTQSKLRAFQKSMQDH